MQFPSEKTNEMLEIYKCGAVMAYKDCAEFLDGFSLEVPEPLRQGFKDLANAIRSKAQAAEVLVYMVSENNTIN